MKIRIFLERVRGEEGIVEICYKEKIYPNMYYSWRKEFLEAGKKRLTGDLKREASSLSAAPNSDHQAAFLLEALQL